METKWTDILKKHGACSEAVEWAQTQPDMATAWAKCERADFMLWFIAAQLDADAAYADPDADPDAYAAADAADAAHRRDWLNSLPFQADMIRRAVPDPMRLSAFEFQL